ncbi:hypothetical protein FF011L_33420 [Roseimaritima multifibrata]|uniref:Uncharacterized protein n=1 Tax=Roseimaritima multifibrata TaxID=1930274 RepID=A0A517MI54_9BACT|nr:hypothetical protein FF011L_33420 [Roseimaritima multifibrata]
MGEKGKFPAGDFSSEDALNASNCKRLCHAFPNAVGPSPPAPLPKKAFESYLIELADEPLIQYQTCFKRACFEGEGSRSFFTYSFHAPSKSDISFQRPIVVPAEITARVFGYDEYRHEWWMHGPCLALSSRNFMNWGFRFDENSIQDNGQT